MKIQYTPVKIQIYTPQNQQIYRKRQTVAYSLSVLKLSEYACNSSGYSQQSS